METITKPDDLPTSLALIVGVQNAFLFVLLSSGIGLLFSFFVRRVNGVSEVVD